MTYDIFNPKDGIVIYTTRYECIARLLAWLLCVDYNNAGEGWV